MTQARRKTMIGRVIGDKMGKTVTVQVATRSRHPLYGKVITRMRHFKAHNTEPLAKAGDTVEIVEARPLSRTKRWRVAEIVRRGEIVEEIREKELEALVEKERAEREARRIEERRRAAERLAKLAGQEAFEDEGEMTADEPVEVEGVEAQ